MAQTWQIIRGSTTYTVSGGTYSYAVAAQGIGAPPKRNISQRGPFQHGHTITDFRYDARQIRLIYHFDKASLALADTNRDSIYNIWKGIEGEPVKFRVTRDDSKVFTIDAEVTGVVDMNFDLQDRIGTSQRFVVTLECGDPFWYDHVTDTVTFTEADNLGWHRALGTISADNTLHYVENPAQAAIISGAAVADGDPWTIAFRSDISTLTPASLEYAFGIKSTATGEPRAAGQLSSTANRIVVALPGDGFNNNVATSFFDTSVHDYVIICDGTTISAYRDGAQVGTNVAYPYGASTRRWRSDQNGQFKWTPELSHAAFYNIAISDSQMTSLITAMNVDLWAAKTIAYSGSWRAYPIITINGPITDPVLTNVTTGDKLDFTGTTIDTGEYYVIDCRYGYKTVKDQAGANKIADLTSDSDLASFHLAPAGEVTSGNNAFTLIGTATDVNTSVSIVYNERFIGI